MGKRNLVLYVEDDLIKIAKAKGINLSQLFNDILKQELEMPLDLDENKTDNLDNAIKKTKLIYAEKKQELNVLLRKKKELDDKKQKEKEEFEKRIIYSVDTDESNS